MEKIFSFFKKNIAIVVLIILVVLMMCQPRKSKKVTENFSTSTALTEEDCLQDPNKDFDTSFEPVCYDPKKKTNWTPNSENCCANKNGTMCYTYKDGNFCYLRHDLTEEMKNKCKGTVEADSAFAKDINYANGESAEWAYKPCRHEYVDFTDKDVTGTRLVIDPDNKTCTKKSDCGSGNACISGNCYNRIDKGSGTPLKQSQFCKRYRDPLNPGSIVGTHSIHNAICNEKVSARIKTCANGCEKHTDGFSYCKDSSGTINTKHLCITSDFDLNPDGFVAHMLRKGKKQLVSSAKMKTNHKKNKKMLKSIQNTTKDSINNLLPPDEIQVGSAFKDLKDNIDEGLVKFLDEWNPERFTETTDNCKLNSNQRKILTDTIAAFNKGLANNQTAAYGGHSYEDAKKKAIHLTNVYLTKAVNSGLFGQIVGDKKDCFISELERSLNIPGKIKILDADKAIIEGFSGVDYDEAGRLREHKSGHGKGSSYLITALTKEKLLSIGQVYQLRKLMLEAFKVVTNRPFFSFYYENFGKIADMLVKENRLSEILQNMLKCIYLSKNGQFDLAFEQYILTARQAYQICKDMGMDTKNLEDKFEQLDGTIDVLPEPNSLFVENGFREALKSC